MGETIFISKWNGETAVKGILKAYVRISNLVVNIGGYLSGILIFLIAGMVFYEIVSRSLFNAPTTWASELSVYALIGSALLGSAYALNEDGHIRVDLLLDRVSIKSVKPLLVATYLLGLLFSLVLLVYGANLVFRTFLIGLSSASMLRIPMYIPYLFIPVGALLLVLAFIQKIVIIIVPELNPLSAKKEGQY